MEDTEFLEAFLTIYAFGVFFMLIGLGAVIVSLNPNWYWYYVDYNPPEDLIIIVLTLIVNFFFTCFLLNNAMMFRTSRDLDKHMGELANAMDNMKIYSLIIHLPIQAIVLYFTIKYVDTSISIYLFLSFLCNLGLSTLIFYNAYSLKRDMEEDKKERFDYDELEPI